MKHTIGGLDRKTFGTMLVEWRSRGLVLIPGSAEWPWIEKLFAEAKEVDKESTARLREKIRGLCGAEVRSNRWGHPELWIDREGRGWSDVSWACCFDPPNKKSRLVQAARGEVGDQISDFRDRQAKPTRCPITGGPLGSDPHVDHEPPNTFDALLKRFCAEHGTPEVHSPDGLPGKMFVDRQLADQWKVFHKANARLRWTSKKGNLVQGRGRS